MLTSVIIASSSVAASACAQAPQPAIQVFDSNQRLSRAQREALREASASRWEISVRTTREIPDSINPIPDDLKMLQDIVDNCQLGQTVLYLATDNGARLEIEETPLANEQIKCIRSYEGPGLLLIEPLPVRQQTSPEAER